MAAEVAEGRGARGLDLRAVGALLGLVGPEPFLLDLVGDLGSPHLNLPAVEAAEDDHEVGHVDLRIGWKLRLERAHRGDLPLCGWDRRAKSYLADDPPGRAIAYRSCHRQPKPAGSCQPCPPTSSSPSTSARPWSPPSRIPGGPRPAYKVRLDLGPLGERVASAQITTIRPRNSSAPLSCAWSISLPGGSPASSPKSSSSASTTPTAPSSSSARPPRPPGHRVG
jgi:hypothetical protein